MTRPTKRCPNRTYRFHLECSEWIFEGLQALFLEIDGAEIVVHTENEPRGYIDFLDAWLVSCQDAGDVDLLPAEADSASAGRDKNAPVVKWVDEFRKSCVRF